eukprot:TRINITY_DN4585_c0_g1_i1.p1 TRINITY_DN4585_c0_g1~~TRINITY_DN4585_c0_g1_i1.p1  ORF type:complete len:674 (-),score=118.46 TRINITY_DN4585_c0_g1_i1:39-2060(-)
MGRSRGVRQPASLASQGESDDKVFGPGLKSGSTSLPPLQPQPPSTEAPAGRGPKRRNHSRQQKQVLPSLTSSQTRRRPRATEDTTKSRHEEQLDSSPERSSVDPPEERSPRQRLAEKSHSYEKVASTLYGPAVGNPKNRDKLGSSLYGLANWRNEPPSKVKPAAVTADRVYCAPVVPGMPSGRVQSKRPHRRTLPLPVNDIAQVPRFEDLRERALLTLENALISAKVAGGARDQVMDAMSQVLHRETQEKSAEASTSATFYMETDGTKGTWLSHSNTMHASDTFYSSMFDVQENDRAQKQRQEVAVQTALREERERVVQTELQDLAEKMVQTELQGRSDAEAIPPEEAANAEERQEVLVASPTDELGKVSPVPRPPATPPPEHRPRSSQQARAHLAVSRTKAEELRPESTSPDCWSVASVDEQVKAAWAMDDMGDGVSRSILSRAIDLSGDAPAEELRPVSVPHSCCSDEITAEDAMSAHGSDVVHFALESCIESSVQEAQAHAVASLLKAEEPRSESTSPDCRTVASGDEKDAMSAHGSDVAHLALEGCMESFVQEAQAHVVASPAKAEALKPESMSPDCRTVASGDEKAEEIRPESSLSGCWSIASVGEKVIDDIGQDMGRGIVSKAEEHHADELAGKYLQSLVVSPSCCTPDITVEEFCEESEPVTVEMP